MTETLTFDFFYGKESQQFSFFRIPKVLMYDKRFSHLSTDAKLLYGLMLDRMKLSIKNNWVDNYGRVFIIYTLDDIMEDFGCKSTKASKLVTELCDKSGIGLIRKVHQGLGKPDIIYVMNFIDSAEKGNDSQLFASTIGQTTANTKGQTTANVKGRPTANAKGRPIANAKTINTKKSDTYGSDSICEADRNLTCTPDDDRRTQVCEQLDYESLVQKYTPDSAERKLLDMIIEVLTATQITLARRISKGDSTAKDGLKKLLEVNSSKVEHVIVNIDHIAKAKRQKPYILKCLLNDEHEEDPQLILTKSSERYFALQDYTNSPKIVNFQRRDAQ